MIILNMRNKRLIYDEEVIELTPIDAFTIAILSNNNLITREDFKKYDGIMCLSTLRTRIFRVKHLTKLKIDSQMHLGYRLKDEIYIDY